jgi:hypothetical protein
VTEHDHWSGPRDPVPDLGFFAGSRPAAPPVPPLPPPHLPLPAPPFGGVPQGPPAFGNVPSAPVPYLHPYAAPARGGLPGWAIALICAVAGVLLILIAAAVAIPVFLHQRDAAVAKATTLSPADQVSGMTQSTDPRMQQATDPMTSALSGCGCFQPAVTSSYQDPDRTHVLIVIGARFLRPADDLTRESFQRNFWKGASASAAGPNAAGTTLGPVRDMDPGRLGGTLHCAAMSTGGAAGQVCLSVDAGAVVTVLDLVRADLQQDPDLIVTARESIEHRT